MEEQVLFSLIQNQGGSNRLQFYGGADYSSSIKFPKYPSQSVESPYFWEDVDTDPDENLKCSKSFNLSKPLNPKDTSKLEIS